MFEILGIGTLKHLKRGDVVLSEGSRFECFSNLIGFGIVNLADLCDYGTDVGFLLSLGEHHKHIELKRFGQRHH